MRLKPRVPWALQQGLETRVRRRVAIGVQQHRDGLVVADDAHDFDYAALAQLLLHAVESGVGHLGGAEQFSAEVVDSLFVGLQIGGRFSFRDGVDNGLAEPACLAARCGRTRGIARSNAGW